MADPEYLFMFPSYILMSLSRTDPILSLISLVIFLPASLHPYWTKPLFPDDPWPNRNSHWLCCSHCTRISWQSCRWSWPRVGGWYGWKLHHLGVAFCTQAQIIFLANYFETKSDILYMFFFRTWSFLAACRASYLLRVTPRLLRILGFYEWL